jgi:hypothetical protein
MSIPKMQMNKDDFKTCTIDGSASVEHIQFLNYCARILQVRKIMSACCWNY